MRRQKSMRVSFLRATAIAVCLLGIPVLAVAESSDDREAAPYIKTYMDCTAKNAKFYAHITGGILDLATVAEFKCRSDRNQVEAIYYGNNPRAAVAIAERMTSKRILELEAIIVDERYLKTQEGTISLQP